MNKKLLVIQAAALGYDFVLRNGYKEWEGLTFRPLEPVFPAVTCTAQATFRTGLPPSKHGIVGNGFLHRELNRPIFWEQSSSLVSGKRIWESFRSRGKTVGMLFWQQSLGETVDVLVSPAPIHKHHGGMIQNCYSKPAGLYQRLRAAVGRDFNLMNYWGPLASSSSSDWIAMATAELLKDKDAPDLCFSYLPVLDYDLQRFGPDSKKAKKAITIFLAELKGILEAARENNYEVLVFGDYAIGAAEEGAILPNLALRNKRLMNCREIKGMLYPDLFTSPAFAVVDHEIAHVYVKDRNRIVQVRDALIELQGVKDVLDEKDQIKAGVAHNRAGELVLIANEGYWFAYPWWEKNKQAPDYATHVDIHNKPGYDPCELFFGWPPPSVSRNTGKIKGSHGRIGKECRSCWAATCGFQTKPATLIELALTVKSYLENMND